MTAGVLLLAGAIGGVTYVVVKRRGPPPRPKIDAQKAEEHAKEVDNDLSPLLAMANSPEASTPCETSYNAILAGQEAGKKSGNGALFVYIAPHDEFIALCEKLPKDAQWCMTPRYSAQHREECSHIRPPDAVLDAMRTPRPQQSAVSPDMPVPMSSAPPPAASH